MIFSKVNWLLIYSKNNTEVYANSANLYEDFRVKIDKKWIDRFQGATAHTACEKLIHNQGIEHKEFDIAEILANAYLENINNLGKAADDE
jgi:hypothetical protein